MATRVRSIVRVLWPPLLFGALFLGVWELIVWAYDIEQFLLPAPSAIWSALVEEIDSVWDAVFVTGSNALVGLVLGVALGVTMSFVMMRFRVFNELATPLAVALNAIPIIVIVPVLNNMFSITTEVPRRLMVMLIVFFIVLVNVSKGLRQVQPLHMELMRSYAATPRTVLIKTRIPNAVPFLFTALKIAAPAAVVTAFVAEYFGGRQNGIGYGITSSAATSDNDVTWAYVAGACALGVTFFMISVGLEKTTVKQAGPRRPGGATT
ncbi:MAG: ABC transporter permease [Actinomycetota bacterium]